MGELEKVERAEKKEHGKSDRKQMRNDKYDAIISEQASKNGIKLSDLPEGPLLDKTKQEITEGVKKGASADMAKDIDSFASATKTPKLQERPVIDRERMSREMKKQRAVRWADALAAFGAGLQGKSVDINNSASARMKAERDNLFREFREITDNNQRVANVWAEKYRDDLLNFLDQKINDKSVNEREKVQLEALKEQLNLTRARAATEKAQADWYGRRPGTSGTQKTIPTYTKQNEDGSWELTNQDNPYSDLYFKLTGNSKAILNELAKQSGDAVGKDGKLTRNLSTADIERYSNSLLSSMFDFEQNEEGALVARPKPGMESYMNDVMSTIREREELSNQYNALKEEYNMAYRMADSRKKKKEVDEQYNAQLSALKQQMNQASNNVTSVLSGTSQPGTAAPGRTTQSTTIDEIANKYKPQK